ncbi:DMT family transporter [Leisingera thetidis]|uniref:DMT family transporter n=1 Tax=Leisingera thetidis TaxID=2930199 RepID=UPI0021F7639D|nr:EamA family transporter [Leisingera thetidis]
MPGIMQQGKGRRITRPAFAAPMHSQARVMLGLSVLLLGVNWPVMKLGLDYFSPFWMVCLRFLLSAPAVAALIVISRRRLPVLTRADVPVILGVAAFQFAGMMGLATLALTLVPAGTASILIYTTPVWLLLIDMILGEAKIIRKRKATALVSAAGCAVIVFSPGKSGMWGALLLILVASALWAIAMRLVNRHKWQGSVRDALFWQMLIAGLALLPVAYFTEGPFAPRSLTPVSVTLLVLIGPVASGAGFGFMIAAGRSLPAARVALISTATPLIGFLSATLALGEPVQAATLIGGGVMLAALVRGGVQTVTPGATAEGAGHRPQTTWHRPKACGPHIPETPRKRPNSTRTPPQRPFP